MGARRTNKLGNCDKKSPKASKSSTSKAPATTENDEEKENPEKTDTPSTSELPPDKAKMTLCTVAPVNPRPTRRQGRPASGKRLTMTREISGKVRSAYKRSLDPCDNSNDSGLGFDHHSDPHQHNVGLSERLTWSTERAEPKRQRMDIKLEHDDINEGYTFPESVRTCKENVSLIRTAPSSTVPHLTNNNNSGTTSGRAVPRCIPLSNRQNSSSAPVPLTTQLTCQSRFLDVSLTIVKQPEQQHRARYQTEGSRGAVKDRDGNGFPVVQLNGYYKPATLQVFIGTDMGKVAPHMFYQACKVSGKNSTPCTEKKIDGTCVIELQLDPSKEMSAICDCVGILKERNVDVEHRFPEQLGNRSKKKSTKCRMIFRTTISLDDGTQETLQVCSQPIVCTQPPGVPEICKKSLTSCPASGGLELFVLGKNFLKDTKVYFQLCEDGVIRWEQAVVPDKEYLQQTHFVCVVPPYRRPDITEPVTVRLCVLSSGKTSEFHQFVYTPINGAMPSVHLEAPAPAAPATSSGPFFKGMWSAAPSISKQEQDLDMMPPPESSLVPMSSTRRSSISVPSSSEVHSPPLRILKQEYIDESSQNSNLDPMEMHQERYRHVSESSLDVHHGDSNMSMINENSMDLMPHHNSMLNHMNENSNLSLVNEDSVEMIRRNSLSRSVCENSNMSTMDEDSSCSTVMHCSNSVVTDRLVLSQPVLHQTLLSTNSVREMPEKVMDLRMKMPLGSVSDLVNTNAPSIGVLERFGMIEQPTPLPAQSAQSVENYLTKIELKNSLPLVVKRTVDDLLIPNQVINPQTCGILATATTQSLSNLGPSDSESVFLPSQRQYLNNNQTDSCNLVAKSEAAAIAEQTLSEQVIVSTAITTIATSLENSITSSINTERLDDLVNSTVESHIGSPNRAPTPKPDVIISSQDVMLNTPNLLVPPIITTRLASPQDLPAEVILNTQLSPSMILPNNICQPPATVVESTLLTSPNLLPSSQSPNDRISPVAALAAEPEKALLLEAAADLLNTQKQICELTTSVASPPSDIITMATTTTPFVAPFSNSVTTPTKTDFELPIPVKEINNSLPATEKKNDDRMIPQSFTALTENELINLINPSCFDQV